MLVLTERIIDRGSNCRRPRPYSAALNHRSDGPNYHSEALKQALVGMWRGTWEGRDALLNAGRLNLARTRPNCQAR